MFANPITKKEVSYILATSCLARAFWAAAKADFSSADDDRGKAKQATNEGSSIEQRQRAKWFLKEGRLTDEHELRPYQGVIK